MLKSFRESVRDARRRTALAGAERAGRYARMVVWQRQWNYVRRGWRYLGLIVVGIPILCAPLALLAPGGWRWLVVGVAGATGFWVAVLTMILCSGAAGALMGLSTESWTSDQLRPLSKRGWRLVNGLKLRPVADIDHVAVGPPGIFVIETKWAEDPWPIDGKGDGFMVDRLTSALKQVRRNCRDVANHFSRELRGAPVHAVLVLWSGSSWLHPADVVDRDGVKVVRGRQVGRWLEGLTDRDLHDEDICRIWDALDRQAKTRDARDEEDSGPPKLTLEQVSQRWVLQPLVGALAAIYAFVAIGLLRNALLILIGCVAGLVLGWQGRRAPFLKQVAWGWVAAFTLILISSAVLIVVALLREP